MTQINREKLIRFNFHLFSRYRTELMGLSAMGIIACHTYANGVVMPGWLWQFFSLGQLGVSVFFFLSGMGIWFSLREIQFERGGVMYWYSRRFKKLFVPFLILALPFFAWQTISEGKNLWFFISRITTIEFWISGGGAWFVSVLVALYLISPWWEWLLCRTGLRTFLSAIAFLLVLCFGGFVMNHSSEICFYFMGFWTAQYVQEDHSIRWLPIIAGTLALYFVFRFIPQLQFFPRSVFLVPLFVILPCLFFELSWTKSISRICGFMGNISLESYLTNVFLPSFFVQAAWINVHPLLNKGNWFGYFLVVVVGITLAWLVHQLSNKILSKTQKK